MTVCSDVFLRFFVFVLDGRLFVRQAMKGLLTYVLKVKGTDYKVATSGGSESLYVG